MTDPKTQEDIEPAFGSLSVQEKYLRSDVEYFKELVKNLERGIKEKEDIIASLNSKINDLNQEIFNLKLRLIAKSKEKPMGLPITKENVEEIIKTRKQAMVFYRIIEKEPSNYKEIAKSAELTKEYVNSYLRRVAKPLIRNLGGGIYTIIEDLEIQGYIREVIQKHVE